MPLGYRRRLPPQVLFGFLLWWIGFGTILLVISSLESRSAATGVGELAVAAVLLVLFARIWRTSEGARWVAGVFAAFVYSRLWRSMLPEGWHVSWLDPVHAFALIVISVGLLRAQPWARWAAGLASILASILLLRTLASASAEGDRPAGLLCIALFWAAIAVYLFLPSTGARFAELRGAREPSEGRTL